MALNDCLKKFPSVQSDGQREFKNPISTPDRVLLQGAVDTYVGRGMDRPAAEVQAVQDLLDEYTAELKAAHAAVRKAFEASPVYSNRTPPPSTKPEVTREVRDEDEETPREKKEREEKEEAQRKAAEVAAQGKEKGSGEVAPKKRALKPAEPKQEVEYSRAGAEAAWNKLHAAYPENVPTWDKLPFKLQQEFVSFGSNNWKLADAAKLLGDKKSRRTQGELAVGMKPDDVRTAVEAFVRGTLSDRVVIVPTLEAIPPQVKADVERDSGTLDERVPGFVHDGKIWLVASNLSPGTVRSVFMHEAGVHVGLEEQLGAKELKAIVDEIRRWATDPLTTRGKLAARALVRVFDAKTPAAQHDSELLAYFIEEAVASGVHPERQLHTPLGRLLHRLWNAMRTAMQRWGVYSFSPQDLVDFAYGAAKVSLGQKIDPSLGKVARTFAGDKAKRGSSTFSKQWIAQKVAAKLMESGGATQEEIWKNTGFFRGVDGLWRWEISDHTASLLPDFVDGYKRVMGQYGNDHGGEFDEKAAQFYTRAHKLVDVLDHWALYQAYPQLKNVTVALDPFTGSSMLNIEDTPAGDVRLEITIGKDDDPLSALLHEIQHAVQTIEGFAPGGSPAHVNVLDKSGLRFMRRFIESRPSDKRVQNLRYIVDKLAALPDNHRLAQLQDDVEWAEDQLTRLDDAMTAVFDRHFPRSEEGFSSATDEELRAYAAEIKPMRDAYDNIKKAVAPAKAELHRALYRFASTDKSNKQSTGVNAHHVMKELRYWMYYTIHGEWEARDTQQRQGLDGKERANMLPTLASPYADSETILYNATPKRVVKNEARRSVASTMPPVKLPPAYANITDTVKDLARSGMMASAFTQDLANYATKLLSSAQDYMAATRARVVDRLRMEAKVSNIYQEYAKLDKDVRQRVDRFIKKSTLSGKWGYAPTLAMQHLVDHEMRSEFSSLPLEAQQVVRNVFSHGYESLRQKQLAVREAINSEYDPDIAAAEKAGDAKKADALKKDKAKARSSFESLLKISPEQPYAHITQFGDHVVVARSAQLQAALDSGNQELIDRLKGDADHYYVRFVSTRGQATALEAELRARTNFTQVTSFRKDDHAKFAVWGGADVLNALNRLRMLARDSIDDKKVLANTDALLRDLYLQTMAENSARKSELRALGVAGTSDEMLRAFVQQGRADAHFIASVKHNAKIVEHLANMQRQAKQGGDEYRKRAYYDEFLRRYANSLEYNDTPIQNTIAAMTSFWFLATSPAYYVQNMTQPVVMSLPVMAARFGYAKSVAQLTQAYTQLAQAGFDMNKLPSDVKGMLQELLNRGQIEIGIEQELGDIVDGYDAPIANEARAVFRKFRQATHQVESINRIVTAIAAYRMSGGSTQYASDVVYQTHGDYTGANAPRLFNIPGARLIMQFKKFQFIQAAVYARLLHDAFKGSTPTERFIAKKALAYTLGHAGAVGGLMGMPFFYLAAWILRQFAGDDEEPDNPEATLRRLIDNEAISDLLLRGAPAALGMDMSGKLGSGNMLNPFGMQDVSFKTPEDAAKSIVALLGPAASLGTKVATGMYMIGHGNMAKGVEQMMPTGVSNAMKGYRFANEGITNKAGEVLVKPEDVSALAAASQAVGLPTTDITKRNFVANATFEANEFYKDRTTEIKRQYAKAVKEGDTEEMAEAREEWRKMQEARKGLGLKPQPLSTLLRAPMEQRKHERDVHEGVPYTKQTRGFVRQLTDQ